MGELLKVYLMPHPPIMVHEIGRGEEAAIAETIKGADRVGDEIEALKPDTIVIVVPPHGPAFSDAMSINTDKVLMGDLGNFGAPQVKFSYDVDMELVDSIMVKSAQNSIPIAPIDKDASRKYRISNKLDHGSLVPLYFVGKKYNGFKLVHITYGLLSNEELYHFGSLIRSAVEDSGKRVVLIASGDLSHRLTKNAPAGFTPKGREFDERLVEYIRGFNTDEIMYMDRELIEAAGECGYRSILVMLGCLDGFNVKSQVYSYEGPFGVGYCVAGFEIGEKNEENKRVDRYYNKRSEAIKRIREREDSYVSLARLSLESYIRKGRKISIPENIPAEMLNSRAGVFVSIKKNGQLRGCIGTIEPTRENVAEEIIENAISSGTRDPRFYPVEEDELDELEYSVDVLKSPEPIESKSELDVKRYGVIVRKGMRCGLLLPNLEGVDTVDEQVKIALRKAGIKEHEDYTMERFEVIRHR